MVLRVFVLVVLYVHLLVSMLTPPHCAVSVLLLSDDLIVAFLLLSINNLIVVFLCSSYNNIATLLILALLLLHEQFQ